MTRDRTSIPTSADDFAEKFAKGSAEFMEQTTHLFRRVSFLNCATAKQPGKEILVDQVIHVPSASATVYSEMTDAFVSDAPQFACEGAIAEWLKALEARKAARQKAEGVRNFRMAASRHQEMQTVREAASDPRWDRPSSPSLEHEGILFTRSDNDVDKLHPPPEYSKSLF